MWHIRVRFLLSSKLGKLKAYHIWAACTLGVCMVAHITAVWLVESEEVVANAEYLLAVSWEIPHSSFG